MQSYRPIKRALISVSDKTGIINFAKALSKRNIEILSTGGTAALLVEHQIPVTEVASYTQFPEMMAGRVKTLHPKIHGGILARRGLDDEVMSQQNILAIDLVVVNLYPFEQAIAKEHCQLQEAIENIDIGGPAMIRSAAKNFNDVTVVVDNKDYQSILEHLEQEAILSLDYRFSLAVKAFEHTAHYDGMIANYFGKLVPDYFDNSMKPSGQFPRTLNQQFIKKQNLRYGENAHQQAAFYLEENPPEASIATAKQLQGKELSYNNIADSDAALECVKSFSQPACVIVKHANPCGVAIADNPLNAYLHAYQTDPTSAFGGIIAFNRPLDSQTATAIIERQFVEVIIAPEIDVKALTIIANKKNIRLLEYGNTPQQIHPELDFKRVTGGLLVQEKDNHQLNASQLTIVSQRSPTEQEMSDALFCWKVAKFVKSNAIVYAKAGKTIGIGAGQMSRVYSAKIAGIKAQEEQLSISGSVMASDAFFPFRDGIDAAASVGVTCVIQPGGSIRDEEVIQAANEHNIAMIFTHIRHFRH